MPPATLRAFADHGDPTRRLSHDTSTSEQILSRARRAGVDLDAITAALEHEGVRAFCDSYGDLLARIDVKVREPAVTA